MDNRRIAQLNSSARMSTLKMWLYAKARYYSAKPSQAYERAVPCRKCRTFSTVCNNPTSITSCVIPALCGVKMTFGSARSGSFAEIGSSWNTSSAAPARCPFRSASTSASRSTKRPLAVFNRNAPGFINARRARLMTASVSALSRKCRLTISDCYSSVSMGT